MDERPSNLDPADDPSSDEPNPRGRLKLWIAALAVLVAIVVVVAMLVPGQSRAERRAVRTAVRHYAELYRQSTESVDQYCKLHAKPIGGGAWLVDVSRPVVPGSGGYRISTTFRVDRNGKSEFVASKGLKGE